MSQLRAAVRNFLLVATEAEVRGELALSIERGDTERAGYVEECLCELLAENADDDEEADFAALEDFLGDDNYPGCGSDEDCVGCPESGDCADEPC
jgi:hypothetical protein